MRTLHVGLQVADPEKSIAFYRRLGYEVLGAVPGTGIGDLTMLKLPEDPFVSIELVHAPDTIPTNSGGLHHLVIGVEDLHAMVTRLADAGISAEPPSSPDHSEEFWTTLLTDPDGYLIELVQWPPGHPPGMTRADLMSQT